MSELAPVARDASLADVSWITDSEGELLEPNAMLQRMASNLGAGAYWTAQHDLGKDIPSEFSELLGDLSNLAFVNYYSGDETTLSDIAASSDDFAGGAAALGMAGGVTALGVTSTSVRGWKVGDPLNNLTRRGTVPSWSAVKKRYWKNEAHLNAENYSAENLARMKKGKAPLVRYPENGKEYPMELHHNPPQRNGGLYDVEPITPWDHNAIDPFRHWQP